MHLFFAKLFEQYQQKNDSAVFNITLYISMIYFFVLFDLFLPVSEIIDKVYFNNDLSYNQFILAIAVFSIMGGLIYGVYQVYINKNLIVKLVEKYKDRTINKLVLNTLTALLPILLLLTGATLTVLLKGGTMFGHKFDGIF